ncbi:MAG: S8 family serine peptidase [Promethearchaeota archaeon]
MNHLKSKAILILCISFSVGLILPHIIQVRPVEAIMNPELSVDIPVNKNENLLSKVAPNLSHATGYIKAILSFKKVVPDNLPFNVLYRYQTKPLVYVEGSAQQIRNYALYTEDVEIAIRDEIALIENESVQAKQLEIVTKDEDKRSPLKSIETARNFRDGEYPYTDENHNVSAKWLADFMGAPPAWRKEKNVYGEGITIALLSTGVNWNHEVFNHLSADQHEDKSFITTFFSVNYRLDDLNTGDSSISFIGTNMAALLIGGPEPGQQGFHNDLFYGFLPKARLLNAKIDNGAGFSFGAELAALDWAKQEGADVCVVAASTSWGIYNWLRTDTEEYWCQLEEEMLGNTVLCYWGYFSSGEIDLLNYGPTGGPMGQHPAQIIAAGSSANFDLRDNKDGSLVFFGTSNNAPLPQSYQIKPDFTVPFYGTSSDYDIVIPDLVSGFDKYYERRFFQAIGTIAAAAMGLVLSAARQDIPNVTPAATHAALLETAIKLETMPFTLDDGSKPPLPDFRQGRGLVNISAAYEYLVKNTAAIASEGEIHANVISGLPRALPIQPLDHTDLNRWQRTLDNVPDLYTGETYYQTITVVSGLPSGLNIPVTITITGNGSQFVEIFNAGRWMGMNEEITRVVGKGDLFPVKLHCDRNELEVIGNTYYAYVHFTQTINNDETTFTVPIQLRIDKPLMVVAFDEFHSWKRSDFRYGMLRLYIAALRDAGIAVTSLPFRWETADLINVDALVMSDNWHANYIDFQRNNDEWDEAYGLGSFKEIELLTYEFEVWGVEETTEWWTKQHLHDIWNYWDQGGRIFHLGPNGYGDIIQTLANGTKWTLMWDRVLSYFAHFGVEMTKDRLKPSLGSTILVNTTDNPHPIFRDVEKGIDHNGGTWKILNSSTSESILDVTLDQAGDSGELSIFVEAANNKNGCMIATPSNWLGDNWGIAEDYHPDDTNNTGAAINTILYMAGLIGDLGRPSDNIVFIDVTGIDYRTVMTGSPHTFEINIFNRAGDPVPAQIHSITATVTDPSGATESLIINKALSTQGHYIFTYLPPENGRYRVSITTILSDGSILHSYPTFTSSNPDVQIKFNQIGQAIEGEILKISFNTFTSLLSLRPWWRWLSFVEPLIGIEGQSPFTEIKANITYQADNSINDLVFSYSSGNIYTTSFRPVHSGTATIIVEVIHPKSGKAFASMNFSIVPRSADNGLEFEFIILATFIMVVTFLGVITALYWRYKK